MSERDAETSAEHLEHESGDEHRARFRHRCTFEAFYRSNRCGSAVGWLADVRDISATGIGLRLNRRFDPGSMLFIELISKQDESSHLLPVTVVHATQTDDSHWVLGCTFARTLTNAELAELVLDQPRGRIFA